MADTTLITTGVDGLDDILGGGLTPDRVYLVEGNPGSGKTTLSLQFLLEGAARGEKGIYFALCEGRLELEHSAASHGWNLDGFEIVELSPGEDELAPENQYTMFQPSEIELSATTRSILAEVERVRPKRVVIDSLSEVRLLAQSALRYRRQILALKQFFIGRGCTVLMLDDLTTSSLDGGDSQLQSVAHGVLALERFTPAYGKARRRMSVMKLRGQRFRDGYHDYVIETGGLKIYPRLVAAEHVAAHKAGKLGSGVPELDALSGGGLTYGTSMLLIGPAGTGKSSIATQYALSACEGGEPAAFFTFDERRETLLARAAGLGMAIKSHVDSGLLRVQQIDPAEMSPGEFVDRVRASVDGREGPPARVVIIDSLNGYLNAMPEEKFLTAQLHELLTFLGQRGVITFLVVAQQGMVGSAMPTPVDATYLADAVMLFRYFEAAGEVRQALSVVKNRTGPHERTIREFRLDSTGIRVGEPLRMFRGVLTGVPVMLNNEADGKLLAVRE